MRRKLVLMSLVLLIVLMMPTSVKAFPELTHESGTETIKSGSYGYYFVVHYTLYDDVDFGGYLNITNDVHVQGPTAQVSLLSMFILNAENWEKFPSDPYQCDKLFELWDINITTGRVAWNYTQYTSIEYAVSIVYWIYYPTWDAQRVTFDYEHWDWARYQPPVTTTTTTIITTDTTITTTETTSEATTTEDNINTTTGENTGANQSGIVILGIVGIIGIGVIGTIIFKHRKKIETISKDAKVLVICPYCGSKTEQGITKCQKCGADL